MNKTLTYVMTASLIAGSLVGCSSNGQSPTPVQPTPLTFQQQEQLDLQLIEVGLAAWKAEHGNSTVLTLVTNVVTWVQNYISAYNANPNGQLMSPAALIDLTQNIQTLMNGVNDPALIADITAFSSAVQQEYVLLSSSNITGINITEADAGNINYVLASSLLNFVEAYINSKPAVLLQVSSLFPPNDHAIQADDFLYKNSNTNQLVYKDGTPAVEAPVVQYKNPNTDTNRPVQPVQPVQSNASVKASASPAAAARELGRVVGSKYNRLVYPTN